MEQPCLRLRGLQRQKRKPYPGRGRYEVVEGAAQTESFVLSAKFIWPAASYLEALSVFILSRGASL